MTLHITPFEGAGALSSFRVGQLLPRLQALCPSLQSLSARHVHLVATVAAPDAAAQREMEEEIGLPSHPLRPAGSVCGIWDGRRDRVYFFELHLDCMPELRLDNREIVAARLASL